MDTTTTLEELFPLDYKPLAHPVSPDDWCFQVPHKHPITTKKKSDTILAPGMAAIKKHLMIAYQKQSRYFNKQYRWSIKPDIDGTYDAEMKYLMTESWETIYSNPFPISGNALNHFLNVLEYTMTDYFGKHILSLPKNSIIPFYSNEFGNFHRVNFDVDGLTFNTSEKLFMLYKAMHFNDHSVAEKIMASEHPSAAKGWGRSVSGFDNAEWDRVRYAYMCRALYCKFTNVERLYEALRDTRDAYMVEASASDTIWGTGIALSNNLNLVTKFHPGMNLLGRALVDVRNAIRNSTNM